MTPTCGARFEPFHTDAAIFWRGQENLKVDGENQQSRILKSDIRKTKKSKIDNLKTSKSENSKNRFGALNREPACLPPLEAAGAPAFDKPPHLLRIPLSTCNQLACKYNYDISNSSFIV